MAQLPPVTNHVSPSDECSEGFFYDHNGTEFCRPECAGFGRIKNGLVILERVAICIGLVSAVAMFVLALSIQKKTL